MKRFLRWLAVLVGLLIVAQLFRPERTNPSTEPQYSIRNFPGTPPAVLSRLERSCFDCHSNQTRWPWYSGITPINYLIVGDVEEARRHMNFSEWGTMKTFKIQSLLDRISDEVSGRDMPLERYLLLHPDASLSDSDITMISNWTDAEQDRLADSVGTGQNDN
jgi:hypothetical protein